MRKLIILAFILVLAAGFLNSCSKGDPPFTRKEPEKYSWSETRCLVDGVDWGDCYISPRDQSNTLVSFWIWSNRLNISAINYCAEPSSELYFVVNNFVGDTGKYILTDFSFGGFVPQAFQPRLQTTTSNTGYIHITEFDTTKKQQKLTATFSFTAVNDTLNKKAIITNGTINALKIKIE